MNKRQLVAAHRVEILALARKHGAKEIRLFGSVARGDETPDSDIDFTVKLEEGRSLFDLGGLLMDLRDLLRCKVDVVSESAWMRERLKRELETDAVAV